MHESAYTVDPEAVDEARRERVSQLCEMVESDSKHWEYAFKRMRRWRQFARGIQWPQSDKEQADDPERLYTANITLRHLKQRTASIYAKNPKFKWRRKKRMNFTYWDGSAQQLQMAMATVNQDQTGLAMAIVQDAISGRQDSLAVERTGETMTALYEHFIGEQIPPTKKMAKKQVFTSLTCGVAYFKQTFQRATELPPDQSRALADNMAQLARLERLSEDLAAGDLDKNAAEMDELRSLIEQIEEQEQIIVREGLALDYPDSTNLIPDKNLTYLPGFVGCGHVTEQYCLTPEQIKEVYGKDVSGHYKQYRESDQIPLTGGGNKEGRDTARVWEIWDRETNSVCTVCDGYFDYLVEPHAPISYTERFYPWFVYAPNATDDTDDPFPPSDVEIIMSQQMEINRAGEGLRQHRWAARPGHVSGSNISESDAKKIAMRKAHDVIVLDGLDQGEDVRAKFQPFPASPIDPNLYNTGPAFTDILRSVGTQEANLGGTSGATATESSLAESSRQSTLASAIDEFDDLLTEMARAGGQILLQEMSLPQVQKIVGRGAVWPEVSREDLANEIFLEVEAGSSGRPNQSHEVQVMERIAPLLFQIPGIKHEWIARRLLRTLDDGINYEDAVDMDALPIMVANGQMQASANRGSMEGQGGSDNAERPPEPGPKGPPGPGQSGFGSENS